MSSSTPFQATTSSAFEDRITASLEQVKDLQVNTQQIQDRCLDLFSENQNLEGQIQDLQARNQHLQPQLLEAQTSPPSKESLVTPDTFHGRDQSKLIPFLLDIESVISSQRSRFPTEQAKISYACSYLRDEAKAWVTPFETKLPQSQPPFMKNFDLFVQELEDVFGDPYQVATASRQIMHIRHRRAAMAYLAEVQRIAAVLNWDNSVMAYCAYDVLRDTIKDELALMELDEALDEASGEAFNEGFDEALDDVSLAASKVDDMIYERQGKRNRDQDQPPTPKTQTAGSKNNTGRQAPRTSHTAGPSGGSKNSSGRPSPRPKHAASPSGSKTNTARRSPSDSKKYVRISYLHRKRLRSLRTKLAPADFERLCKCLDARNWFSLDHPDRSHLVSSLFNPSDSTKLPVYVISSYPGEIFISFDQIRRLFSSLNLMDLSDLPPNAIVTLADSPLCTVGVARAGSYEALQSLKMGHESDQASKLYQQIRDTFQLGEAVYVSIDTESWEQSKGHDTEVLEIGWSILKFPSSSSTPTFSTHHRLVYENVGLKNGRYVPDVRGGFQFGPKQDVEGDDKTGLVSTWDSSIKWKLGSKWPNGTQIQCITDIANELNQTLRSLFTESNGNLYLVFHDYIADVPVLNDLGILTSGWIPIWEQSPDASRPTETETKMEIDHDDEDNDDEEDQGFIDVRATILDTKRMFASVEGKSHKQGTSLSRMASLLSVYLQQQPCSLVSPLLTGFHNAANDAYFTLFCFYVMANGPNLSGLQQQLSPLIQKSLPQNTLSGAKKNNHNQTPTTTKNEPSQIDVENQWSLGILASRNNKR